MTTQNAVQTIARIFADAEDAARKTKDSFRSARTILGEIQSNGDSGALVTQKYAGRMDALATKFEADVWALHEEMTSEAAKRNIDVPSVLRDGSAR